MKSELDFYDHLLKNRNLPTSQPLESSDSDDEDGFHKSARRDKNKVAESELGAHEVKVKQVRGYSEKKC